MSNLESESIESLFSTDGDISKSLDKLFSDKNLSFITELDLKEIRAIAVILFLSDYLEIPDYKTFIKNFLKLKVSKDRKGRSELIQMFTGMQAAAERKQDPGNDKLIR